MKAGLLFLIVLLAAGGLLFGLMNALSPSEDDILGGGTAPAPASPEEPVAENAGPVPPAPTPKAGDGPVAVAGRVLDPAGSPVSGATVVVSRVPSGSEIVQQWGGMRVSAAGPDVYREIGRVCSGRDGGFELRSREEGPFRVVATAMGFASTEERGVASGTQDLTLRLLAAGSVSGRVQDEEGDPIAGARVVAPGADGTATGDDGTFLIPNVAVGNGVSLTASAPGYEDAAALVDVRAEGVSAVSDPIVLAELTGLLGRVLSPHGEPVANAMAFAGKGEGLLALQGGSSGSSDEDGRWFLGDPPGGEVTLMIRHPDYLAHTSKVRYESGRRVVVPDIRLEPGGTIVGRVLDPDGHPVSGAQARAVPQNAGLDFGVLILSAFSGGMRPGSDAEGNYRVAGLESGKYTLRVAAPGYRPFSEDDVEVVVGETTTVDVRLSRGNSISGVVLDPSGKPVEGAMVTVETPFSPANFQEAMTGATPPAIVETDGAGRFTAEGLGDDPVTVRAEFAAFAPATLSGVVPGSTDLVLRLGKAGTISGRVVSDDTGEPVAGVAVQLMVQARDGGFASHTARSTEDGSFEITGIEPGEYRLQADSEEYAPWSGGGYSIGTGGAEIRDVEIRLQRGHSLRVLVVGPAGRPVAGATVGVSGPLSRSIDADDDGRAVLSGLPPGSYAVRAGADDLATATVSGVGVPATPELRVQLTRGGAISGVVRDAEGLPVEGRMVTLSEGGDIGGDSTTTDAGGEFRFDHVAPGAQTVVVIEMSGGLSGGMGFDMQSKQVTVVEGREVRVEFGGGAAPRKVHLTGKLLDRGAPAGNRMMLFIPLAGGPGSGVLSGFKMATTDDGGAFDVPGLKPGKYAVMIGNFGSGDMGASIPVEIDESGEISRDLELPSGRLTGTVVRGDTGEPVAGARVVLLDTAALSRPIRSAADAIAVFIGQVRTDEKGAFELVNARPGTCSVMVRADDLAVQVRDGVTVSEQGGAPLHLSLATGSLLSLEAVDPERAPVGGASVTVYDAAGRWLPVTDDMSFETEDDGTAELRLEPGTYRVQLQAEGFAPASAAVSLAGNRSLTVAFLRGGAVDIVVTGAEGPVAGARAAVFGPDGREIYRAVTQMTLMSGGLPDQTDDTGRLVLTDQPPGKLRIVLTAPDGRKGEAEVVVTSGGRAQVAIGLE